MIKLEKKQVFAVRKLTAEPLAYAKDTKLEGQTYHRFRYNGVVFTVNSNDPFIKAFDNGALNEINLLESERINDAGEKVVSYELDYFVTNDQAFGVIEFDARCLALTNIAVRPATVAELEELA